MFMSKGRRKVIKVKLFAFLWTLILSKPTKKDDIVKHDYVNMSIILYNENINFLNQ